MKRKIGEFTEEVIALLGLDVKAGTPIYISDTNITHMQTSHPADFEKYGENIESIIAAPDYVGKNAKDDSIEFTKEYVIDNEYVKVAVRVSTRNIYYARSLYILNNNRVKNYIEKGTLKQLDK